MFIKKNSSLYFSKLFRFLFCFFLLIFKYTPSHGWSEYPHLLGTQIAWDHLDPHTQEVLSYYTPFLKDIPPLYSNFVYSSLWADQIRKSMPYFNKQHYINSPYNPENLPSIPKKESSNILIAIENSIQSIKNPKSTEIEIALALRLLIHFVLDIHQPLHALNYYSKEFPKGDLGGNRFEVYFPHSNGKKEKINLHRVWDRIFLTPRPYSSTRSTRSNLSIIQREATLLLSRVELEEEKTKILDHKQWHSESYKIATNFVYPNIISGELLPLSYIQKGKHIAEKQIVLGGIRLSILLQNLFKNHQIPKRSLWKKLKQYLTTLF